MLCAVCGVCVGDGLEIAMVLAIDSMENAAASEQASKQQLQQLNRLGAFFFFAGCGEGMYLRSEREGG